MASRNDEKSHQVDEEKWTQRWLDSALQQWLQLQRKEKPTTEQDLARFLQKRVGSMPRHQACGWFSKALEYWWTGTLAPSLEEKAAQEDEEEEDQGRQQMEAHRNTLSTIHFVQLMDQCDLADELGFWLQSLHPTDALTAMKRLVAVPHHGRIAQTIVLVALQVVVAFAYGQPQELNQLLTLFRHSKCRLLVSAQELLAQWTSTEEMADCAAFLDRFGMLSGAVRSVPVALNTSKGCNVSSSRCYDMMNRIARQQQSRLGRTFGSWLPARQNLSLNEANLCVCKQFCRFIREFATEMNAGCDCEEGPDVKDLSDHESDQHENPYATFASIKQLDLVSDPMPVQGLERSGDSFEDEWRKATAMPNHSIDLLLDLCVSAEDHLLIDQDVYRRRRMHLFVRVNQDLLKVESLDGLRTWVQYCLAKQIRHNVVLVDPLLVPSIHDDLQRQLHKLFNSIVNTGKAFSDTTSDPHETFLKRLMVLSMWCPVLVVQRILRHVISPTCSDEQRELLVKCLCEVNLLVRWTDADHRNALCEQVRTILSSEVFKMDHTSAEHSKFKGFTSADDCQAKQLASMKGTRLVKFLAGLFVGVEHQQGNHLSMLLEQGIFAAMQASVTAEESSASADHLVRRASILDTQLVVLGAVFQDMDFHPILQLTATTEQVVLWVLKAYFCMRHAALSLDDVAVYDLMVGLREKILRLMQSCFVQGVGKEFIEQVAALEVCNDMAMSVLLFRASLARDPTTKPELVEDCLEVLRAFEDQLDDGSSDSSLTVAVEDAERISNAVETLLWCQVFRSSHLETMEDHWKRLFGSEEAREQVMQRLVAKLMCECSLEHFSSAIQSVSRALECREAPVVCLRSHLQDEEGITPITLPSASHWCRTMEYTVQSWSHWALLCLQHPRSSLDHWMPQPAAVFSVTVQRNIGFCVEQALKEIKSVDSTNNSGLLRCFQLLCLVLALFGAFNDATTTNASSGDGSEPAPTVKAELLCLQLDQVLFLLKQRTLAVDASREAFDAAQSIQSFVAFWFSRLPQPIFSEKRSLWFS